jgi:hypothetical protein
MPDAVTFREAAENDQIVRARFAVLDTAHGVFTRLADVLQTSGWIGRDHKELAAALLIRQRVYAFAAAKIFCEALLHQLRRQHWMEVRVWTA